MRHRWHGWDEDGAPAFSGPAGEPVTVRPERDHPGARRRELAAARVRRRLGRNPRRARRRGRALAARQHGLHGRLVRELSRPLRGRAAKADRADVRGRRRVRGEADRDRGTGSRAAPSMPLSALLREAIDRRGRRPARARPAPRPVRRGRWRSGWRPAAAGSPTSTFLRKAAGLAPRRDRASARGCPALPSDPAALAALVKAVPLRLTGVKPLERAISTAGGARLRANSTNT